MAIGRCPGWALPALTQPGSPSTLGRPLRGCPRKRSAGASRL